MATDPKPKKNLDYVSITPLLHVGEWCPFAVQHPHGPRLAARLIRRGSAVIVADVDIAKQTMYLLGMTEDEVKRRLEAVGLGG